MTIEISETTGHVKVPTNIEGKVVMIDKECVDLVTWFNNYGLKTKYSCRGGDGQNRFYIMFQDDTKDSDIDRLLTLYHDKFGFIPTKGRFIRWSRWFAGGVVPNWIYESFSVEEANIDYKKFTLL